MMVGRVSAHYGEHFYTYDRPHGAHGGRTPYEVLREKLS